MKEVYNELIKKAAINAMKVIMSFNVPVYAIKAPIANDYLRYNSYANHGELVNAKLWLLKLFLLDSWRVK